jgi:rubrerythrin
MANKSLEALKKALRREEEGKAYYQKARDNATNQLGKERFEFLIRAEGSHIQKNKTNL